MEVQPNIKMMPDEEQERLILKLRQEMQHLRLENRRQRELIKIHKLWLKHKGKLFPTESGDKEVQSIDLVMLESDTAGCISVFLEREELDEKRKEVLQKCRENLEVVGRTLNAYGGFYYRQRKKLVCLVLDYININEGESD